MSVDPKIKHEFNFEYCHSPHSVFCADDYTECGVQLEIGEKYGAVITITPKPVDQKTLQTIHYDVVNFGFMHNTENYGPHSAGFRRLIHSTSKPFQYQRIEFTKHALLELVFRLADGSYLVLKGIYDSFIKIFSDASNSKQPNNPASDCCDWISRFASSESITCDIIDYPEKEEHIQHLFAYLNQLGDTKIVETNQYPFLTSSASQFLESSKISQISCVEELDSYTLDCNCKDMFFFNRAHNKEIIVTNGAYMISRCLGFIYLRLNQGCRLNLAELYISYDTTDTMDCLAKSTLYFNKSGNEMYYRTFKDVKSLKIDERYIFVVKYALTNLRFYSRLLCLFKLHSGHAFLEKSKSKDCRWKLSINEDTYSLAKHSIAKLYKVKGKLYLFAFEHEGEVVVLNCVNLIYPKESALDIIKLSPRLKTDNTFSVRVCKSPRNELYIVRSIGSSKKFWLSRLDLNKHWLVSVVFIDKPVVLFKQCKNGNTYVDISNDYYDCDFGKSYESGESMEYILLKKYCDIVMSFKDNVTSLEKIEDVQKLFENNKSNVHFAQNFGEGEDDYNRNNVAIFQNDKGDLTKYLFFNTTGCKQLVSYYKNMICNSTQ